MICNIEDNNYLNEIIKKEGLDLLVVSYGGSCSNTLVEYLKKNGYNCDTDIYKRILCHSPHYVNINVPIIYIYDNPIKSFISQKNRGMGMWGVNQRKMSNNNDVKLSDENLLQLMIKQFNSWTSEKRDNVLIIKSNEIFEKNIVQKLENFLKKKINYFPIEYKVPKTNIENINDPELIKLFEKYKLEIDKINSFKIIN